MTSNIYKNKVLVVLGPTASGKTALGVRLAKELDGEIVSADSRQVYRGMDIGSGKDLDNYELKITNYELGKEETVKIPYHLIDVAEPNEVFDVAQYKKAATAAIDDILSRGKLPIVVGGSGLYLQALVDDYDLPAAKPDTILRERLEEKTLAELQNDLQTLKPDFFAKLNNSDKNNKRRLIRYVEINQPVIARSPESGEGRRGNLVANNDKYDWLLIGLTWPKEILQERSYQRLLERLDKENLVGEVERLNNEGVAWRRLESFGLEYKFVAYYLQGKLDYDAMVAKLNIAINQFIKRQITWFKRWVKQGAKINWFEAWPERYEEILTKIKDFLA
jgi:tRNA dimethylallyltransferase